MNGSETADHGGVHDSATASARRQVTLDIRTESTPCGDVQVIRPTGLVERGDIGRIQRTVRSSPLPVIIELDDCILVGTSPFTPVPRRVHDSVSSFRWPRSVHAGGCQ